MQLRRALCSLVMPLRGLQELMSAQKVLEQAAVLWATRSPTGAHCWLQGFSKAMTDVL